MDIRVFLVVFILKLVSSYERPPYVYLFNVNQLREPLTNYDRYAKTVKYCVYMNNRTLDINYLLGTWYSIYKFSKNSNGGREEYCPSTNFTMPTKEQLDEYIVKYNLQNDTFTFDDGAVLCSQQNGGVNGIVVGNKTAKYYFPDTKSSQRLTGIYVVLTYKPVNRDYMIYYECNMRGQVKYLWSKRNNQTDRELENVLKPLYELEDLKKQQFCWKGTVRLTTPYF